MLRSFHISSCFIYQADLIFFFLFRLIFLIHLFLYAGVYCSTLSHLLQGTIAYKGGRQLRLRKAIKKEVCIRVWKRGGGRSPDLPGKILQFGAIKCAFKRILNSHEEILLGCCQRYFVDISESRDVNNKEKLILVASVDSISYLKSLFLTAQP